MYICKGVPVEDWFGLELPMEGVKSTSLIYHDLDSIKKEPYACFCQEDRNNCHLELYPRLNGTIIFLLQCYVLCCMYVIQLLDGMKMIIEINIYAVVTLL